MSRNVVVLRDGGGPCLVCVHPASGLATSFRKLAQHLPGNGAVFAFENPEPRGSHPTLTELAERYWRQLEAPGPFFFLGWSFGGAIALELAARAEADGQRVLGVGLLDAGAPHLLASADSLPVRDLAGLFGLQISELGVGAMPTNETEILQLLANALRTSRGIAQIDPADLEPFVAAYRWHHAVARRPWVFGKIRAPVYLIRARDEEGWSDAPADLGWGDVFAPAPSILWTPGTHHSLLSDEHAAQLACEVSALMRAGGAA